MIKTRYVRKTYYGAPEDASAIETIKARFGCSTDSDAIRMALRLVAESPVQLAKKKTGTR